MERILVMLKPDVVLKAKENEIINKIKNCGYDLTCAFNTTLSLEEAKDFYIQIKDEYYYDRTVNYIMSGVVLFLIFYKENAIKDFYGIKKQLRDEYGIDITRNAIHSSDSVESTEREISFLNNIMQIENNKILDNYVTNR